MADHGANSSGVSRPGRVKQEPKCESAAEVKKRKVSTETGQGDPEIVHATWLSATALSCFHVWSLLRARGAHTSCRVVCSLAGYFQINDKPEQVVYQW